MARKTAYMSIILLSIFVMEMMSSLSILGTATTSVTDEIAQMQLVEAKARQSEELRVIIGAPAALDENEPLTIIVAGLRNAKAVYVKPSRVTIELFSNDPTLSETDNEKEFIISMHESWLTDDGQWITHNASTSVTKISEILYKTTFPAIEQSTSVKIRATMEWVSPWHEIMESYGEHVITIGKWRNYTQYLETEADGVRANVIDGFTEEVEETTVVVEEVADNMDKLNSFLNTKFAQDDFAAVDPANFHFYLLNVTSIIDTDESNSIISFVEQMSTTGVYMDGKTEKQYYLDLLAEINQSFLDSLAFLDARGIGYNFTNVNYTYTHTVYEDTIDGNGGVPAWGYEDADWDDENWNDTSVEFLLEGGYWSGHPTLIHRNHNFTFENVGLNSGNPYTLQDLVDNHEFESNNTEFEEYGFSYASDINLYKGFVKIYELVGSTWTELIEDTDFVITDGATEVKFLNDYTGSEMKMEIIQKGGYKKSNKAIIVNLMADLFPILNRFYSNPRDLGDDGFYKYPDDPNYKEISTQLLRFRSDDGSAGGIVDDDGSSADGSVSTLHIEANIDRNNDILDVHYANITDYILRIGTLNNGLPHWINSVSKPFARLVYDGNVEDGDSYNKNYTEFHLTANLIKTLEDIGAVEEFDLDLSNFVMPIFNFFDSAIHFTGDTAGGTISPKASVPQRWYYKNDLGKFVDVLFNGTSIDGNDPNHYGMIESRPDAWTFRYINPDVSETAVPSDFQISPFQGADDYVPIGTMSLGNVVFIQNSMRNLTAGFVYSFGMIVNLYYRAFLATEMQLTMLKDRMTAINNTAARNAIATDIIGINQAWIDLDFDLLNEYQLKATDYWENGSNDYTSEGGKSAKELMVDEVDAKIQNSLQILKNREANATYIDNEVSNTQYDVEKLGMLAEVIKFLENQVIPWIQSVRNEISSKAQEFVNKFGDWQESMVKNFKDSVSTFNTQLETWNDNFKVDADKWAGDIENSFNKDSEFAKNFRAYTGVITGAIAGVAATTLAGFIANAAGVHPGGWAAAVIVGVGIVAGLGVGYLATKNTDSIINALSNVGMTVGGVVRGVTDKLYNGFNNVRTNLNSAMERVGDSLTSIGNRMTDTLQTIKGAFDRVGGKIAEVAILTVKSMVTTLKSIQAVMDKVGEVLTFVFNAVSRVFADVKAVIQTLSNYVIKIMGESLGRIKDVMSNVSGRIFDKLKTAEERLMSHSGFIKIKDTLASAITRSRIFSGFITYATDYGRINEEVIMKWVDAIQPMAIVESADRGFYVFQMGDEFAKELYFVVVYQGELVDPDERTLTVRRWADLTEYNDEGEDLLESFPTIYPFEVDGEHVEGIFYCNLTEGTKAQWYKESATEPYVEDAYSEGNYMTIFNCTFYDTPEWGEDDIYAYWAVKTKMYTQNYIADAFPVINVTGYDAAVPFEVVAGGDEIVLVVNVHNEMWSTPRVSIDMVMIDDEGDLEKGGSAIAQIKYSNIPLSAEDSTAVAAGWRVNTKTPGGEHLLVISVYEENGDVTSILARIKVIQNDPLVDFMYSFFTTGWGFGAIGLVVAGLFMGIFIFRKAKSALPKMALTAINNVSVKASKPKCDPKSIRNGLCLPK